MKVNPITPYVDDPDIIDNLCRALEKQEAELLWRSEFGSPASKRRDFKAQARQLRRMRLALRHKEEKFRKNGGRLAIMEAPPKTAGSTTKAYENLVASQSSN